MNLEDLTVKTGDPIKPAWERFKKWVESYRPYSGSRAVCFNMVPGRGTWVTVRTSAPSYTGFFAVTLNAAQNTITVGKGVIQEDGNGSFIPYIGQKRVDGVKSDGTTDTPPTFNIAGSPNADLESWIVIQAPVVQATGQFNPKNPQAIQIAHVNTLTPPKNQLIGQQEIALIRWSDVNTPAEVFQIIRANLKHEFMPTKKGGNVGRHFFYAV